MSIVLIVSISTEEGSVHCKTIPSLPSEVVIIVVEIATILDNNYEKERAVDHDDLGGYILIAEVAEDVENT